MKSLRLPLFSLALAALAPLSAPAQTAPSPEKANATSPKKGPRKTEVTWSRVSSREMQELRNEYEALSKKYLDQHPRMVDLRERMQAAEKRQRDFLDIVFVGGSLNDLLGAIGSGFISVIATNPADLQTELPPFTLRNASLSTVTEVVANLLLNQSMELRAVGGDQSNLAEANSITAVLRRLAPSAEAKYSGEPAFESFQLSDYVSPQQSVTTIVEAITTAWQLYRRMPGDDSLRLKYHEPTKTLFVAGPAPATTIARQVIASLRKNPIAP